MIPDHGNRKHLEKEIFNTPSEASNFIDILNKNGIPDKDITRIGTVVKYRCTSRVNTKIMEE